MKFAGPQEDPKRYSYDDEEPNVLDEQGEVWVYRGQRESDNLQVTVRKGTNVRELERWKRRKELLDEVRGSLDEVGRQAVVEWLDTFVVQHRMFGNLYGVVTWVDGAPLNTVFREPPNDSDDALKRLKSLENIVPVLVACEKLEVRYGDVKPSNIVLTSEGRCVLIDPGCIGTDQDGQRYHSPPWIPDDVQFAALDVVGLANCVWWLLAGVKPGEERRNQAVEMSHQLLSHLRQAREFQAPVGETPIAAWWDEMMRLVPGAKSQVGQVRGVGPDPDPTRRMTDDSPPSRPPGPMPEGHHRPHGSPRDAGSTGRTRPTAARMGLQQSLARRLQSDVDYRVWRQVVAMAGLAVGAVLPVGLWVVFF